MPCMCAVRKFLDARNEDDPMKSTRRVVLGFLLAPLVTPLTFLEARWGTVPAPLLIWVGYFAYGAAVIFGGPAFLLCRMLRLKNPLWFLTGGGLIGWIVFLLLGAVLPGLMRYPVGFVIAASLSALTFRLIAGSEPFERLQKN